MIAKKAEAANLENKKTLFLEVGLIMALAIVLIAFNWKTYEKTIQVMDQRRLIDIPEEMIPITEQKPPEPARPVIPASLVLINIVEDDAVVDDEIVIDAEATQMTEIPDYVPPVPKQSEEENIAEEEIFLVVESAPEFPGGEAGLFEYLSDNLKYPEMAKEASISGRVYVTFVVEKDGSITGVRVLRGIGGGCDEEAVRVVMNMPRWKPGYQRTIPVRVQFNLPIKFTLEL
jgi:protein TonB